MEAAVEDHYATVPFSDAEREETRKVIATDLGERVTTAKQEIDRCQGVLKEVTEQERKLLHMHYEDRISGDLFDDEQARLRMQRQDAEALIDRLNLGYDDVAGTLALALDILSEDLHDLYLQGDNTIRRLINQAIFNGLFVCDETITQAELAEPFAQLRALYNAIRGIPSTTDTVPTVDAVASATPENAKAPVLWEEREPFDVGSISDVMVGPAGLEPATYRL